MVDVVIENNDQTGSRGSGPSDHSADDIRTHSGKRPHYLDLEEARELLAQMNVRLSKRQMKRSSDMGADGKRKLPWFVDPIEGRLKIERNALLSAYFNRQVEAERNCDRR